MIAAYYLVIVLNAYYSGYKIPQKIPMQSITACMTAKNIVMDNGIADKAVCVPTGEK